MRLSPNERAISTLLLAVAVSAVYLGCATTGAENARSPGESFTEALRLAGVEVVEFPSGNTIPLVEEIGARGVSLRSPAGWRFRSGSLAATPGAQLEFESDDGRITGAIEIVPTEVDARLAARTLLLTELHRKEGVRGAYEADPGFIFGALHELPGRLSGVTIIRQLDGAILALGAQVRRIEERDVRVLSEIARQVRRQDERQFRRTALGGRLSIEAELANLEWLADVDGGGLVVTEPATGAIAAISLLDPRELPELDGVAAAIDGPAGEATPVPGLSGDQWRQVGATQGWLGDDFDLWTSASSETGWILSRRDAGFSEASAAALEALATSIAEGGSPTGEETGRTDSDHSQENGDTPSNGVSSIDFPTPVAAYIPVAADAGGVAGQIEALLTDTVDTTLRLSRSILVADTRSIAVSELPPEAGARRDALFGRTEGLSPTWVLATEVLDPSRVAGASGTLPVVRVTIANASREGATTIERQLESVFDIFPLIDEVSSRITGELGEAVTAFGALTVRAPQEMRGLTVEIDGRPLPAGRLSFERFPAGSYELRVTQAGRGGRVTLLEEGIEVPPLGAVTVDVPARGLGEETRDELRRLTIEARQAIADGNDSKLAWTQLSALETIGALPMGADERRRIYSEVIPPPEGSRFRPVVGRLKTQQMIRELATLPGGTPSVTFGGLLSTFLSPEYYAGHYPVLVDGLVEVDGRQELNLLLFPIRATTLGDGFWRYNSGRIPESVTAYEDSIYRYYTFAWNGSVPRNLRWYISTEGFGSGFGVFFTGAGEAPVRRITTTFTGGQSGEEAITLGEPNAATPPAIVAFSDNSMEVAIPAEILRGNELHIRYYGASTGDGEIRRPTDPPERWDW